MVKLQAQTKFLIVGMSLSIIAFGLGQYHLYDLRMQREELVAACNSLPRNAFGDQPICDPYELYLGNGYENPSSGIQGQIVSTQEKLFDRNEWAEGVPFGVLIISLVPWFWYFLLQRVKELSNAIRGE